MRKRLPGYSISLDRKKQYSQSRLQMAPVGLAIRWNASGAPGPVRTGPNDAVGSPIAPPVPYLGRVSTPRRCRQLRRDDPVDRLSAQSSPRADEAGTSPTTRASP